MRNTPSFVLTDPAEIRRLIRENPWATLVSHTSTGDLVASHYPMLLDESVSGTDTDSGELVLVTHVGRPDEQLHELGQHEMIVIIQGPHGYVSPGWYDANPAVPTWNFITAHLYGTPEILSAEENLLVLDRLVDHFEERLPEPRRLHGTAANSAYADRISAGTVGFRLRVTRVVAKSKLSQNKPPETVDRIISELEGTGPYASVNLAAEMRRAHGRLSRAARAGDGS
ncbi:MULTISPECIES: FMN-binding negative transcriptional regulator [unclassified Cryobacterium]|uniref:FMN-binding negative transcriptional regulator n=1 Tax=unclassified Cryobacterium TaxID=2649013 RepID=UPI00106A70B7|nr:MULTISPECIES: FMN-binding negative transcriptional regulator [unclassified Cryobacterium]MEB0287952.1 FMN-binding negative transcriptional regulator [Cryobacterium sp. 10S3]MEB0306638.1 FMN-binding negative transcriptional regulator [Cryobacterium sp. 10I1]TFB96600.1 FMN-binding negative transcriptional regulator [Cryobacterium sp. MDB2-A-1]TFC02924.1 FMN-binding negative transcriptional regulator [Cryobacterium sp. MDB2-33-2]TFC12884.1 FMN-binding negative transcriptional regulator [Cryoba